MKTLWDMRCGCCGVILLPHGTDVSHLTAAKCDCGVTMTIAKYDSPRPNPSGIPLGAPSRLPKGFA